jgi:hypothetical protein
MNPGEWARLMDHARYAARSRGKRVRVSASNWRGRWIYIVEPGPSWWTEANQS